MLVTTSYLSLLLSILRYDQKGKGWGGGHIKNQELEKGALTLQLGQLGALNQGL